MDIKTNTEAGYERSDTHVSTETHRKAAKRHRKDQKRWASIRAYGQLLIKVQNYDSVFEEIIFCSLLFHLTLIQTQLWDNYCHSASDVNTSRNFFQPWNSSVEVTSNYTI